MPNYYQMSVYNSLPTGISSYPYTSKGTGGSNCCCPSTSNFLDTLAKKLYDMTVSLKKQFDEMKCWGGPNQQTGIVLASIEASANVQVKFEYVHYILRYGPPVNGIFDPELLAIIRTELEM